MAPHDSNLSSADSDDRRDGSTGHDSAKDNPNVSSRTSDRGGFAISARNLCFTYDKADSRALSDLNLDVLSGSMTAVVGASGAGKSTLCLTLNGLIPAFVRGRLEGELVVLGRKMGDVPVHEMASSVGMVLQDFEAQLFSTSAELEVAFGMENLGVDPVRMRKLVASSLAQAGLAGFEKRDPSGLSGGEKQRLALAAVLAMEPELLVMDEPTSDLDPLGRRDVLNVVRKLVGKGRSILIAEHETDELLNADQIIVLQHGRVILSDTPEMVFMQPHEPEVGGEKPMRLEDFGVRPPQLAELSRLLKLDAMPLDLDSAEEAIGRLGLKVDKGCCEELRASGNERADRPVVLKARNIAHSYDDDREAVDNVSLEIREGDYVAMVGPNGSGKTTLAKHFNGLLSPQSGTVEVAGADIRGASLSAISQRVGYVFQNPDHQIFCETVSDELAFGPRNAALEAGVIAERNARALRAVQMEGFEESDPFALTKGQRQRVALASVLVMEPSVIVMDEPTTGLDYAQQKHVMDLLCELNRRGHTIVIITHSLWLAAQYARRMIVMHEGKVVADGPTRDVMSGPDGIERWSLVSPPAIALARRLGVPALDAKELAFCLGVDPGLGPRRTE